MAEIGAMRGPTQQHLKQIKLLVGKQEQDDSGKTFYTPEQFAYYQGMTQQTHSKLQHGS